MAAIALKGLIGGFSLGGVLVRFNGFNDVGNVFLKLLLNTTVENLLL